MLCVRAAFFLSSQLHHFFNFVEPALRKRRVLHFRVRHFFGFSRCSGFSEGHPEAQIKIRNTKAFNFFKLLMVIYTAIEINRKFGDELERFK
jgi:hypothetical protein